MKHKTLFFRLMMALLMMALAFPATGLAKSSYSVDEIRQQVADGWHQTYTAHSREIAVDVSIEIPDVSVIPVLSVRKPSEGTPKAALEDFTQVFGNTPGHVGGRIGKDYTSVAGAGKVMLKQRDVYLNGAIPDALPEDNPVDYPHALQTVTSRIEALTGLSYEKDFALSELQVCGRYYQHSVKKDEDVWGKPHTELGYYQFYFEPCFNGIPCPTNGTTGYMAAEYVNDESMSFVLFFSENDSIVYEDVPICSFAEVRGVLEEHIQEGLLRSVDSIQLCYAPFQDQKDSEKYWLLPVWQVSGTYAENSKQEFEQHTNEQGEMETIENKETLYVLAQNAHLIRIESQPLYGSKDVPVATQWK